MLEREPRIEREEISLEKRELLDLEKTGEYVFHGSGVDLDILEPRQAIDNEKGPDGKPAVFATELADFAIFAAIVNEKNCPQGSRTEKGVVTHDDVVVKLKLGATQQTFEQLTDGAFGYVYVFNKKDFDKYEKNTEFVSHVPVKAVRKIMVRLKDLPKDIEII